MKSSRRKHTPAFKAKVALAAIQEQQSIAEISRKYGVHSNQVTKWRKQLLDNLPSLFERQNSEGDSSEREGDLLKKIGELTVERDFLSRVLGR